MTDDSADIPAEVLGLVSRVKKLLREAKRPECEKYHFVLQRAARDEENTAVKAQLSLLAEACSMVLQRGHGVAPLMELWSMGPRRNANGDDLTEEELAGSRESCGRG